MTSLHWREYDGAAEWCARRGLKGAIGDPLPDYMSPIVHEEINADPEAFEQRVRDTVIRCPWCHITQPVRQAFQLGRLRHYRCRHCGGLWSSKSLRASVRLTTLGA